MSPQESKYSSVTRLARVGGYEGSRPNVRVLIPSTAQRVMDLGCSSGALGAALKESRDSTVEVVGIEADPAYARDAALRLDRVECLDLNQFPAERELRNSLGEFDCVVAADVLEHHQNPWAVLKCAVDMLRVGGTAVVSLPNVRHWSVARAVFWRGSWELRDAGIFDRTYLRWFTLRDATHLITTAGATVAEVHPQYWEPKQLRALLPVMNRSPLRELFAYAFVIRAVRAARDD
jgi:methionine biosynthesis protein MetW